jgi:UDP-glucose:(galactosyl)LPS alpha-1,2-glucosyltransferase
MLPIVTITDKRYVVGTKALLYSILNNESMKNVKFDFYIVFDSQELSKEDLKLEFKELNNNFVNIYFVNSTIYENNQKVLSYIPKSVLENKDYWRYGNPKYWLKLFLHDALPKKVDKVLFLDSDIMVMNNFIDLLLYELKNKFAACADVDYINLECEKSNPNPYFNSGVFITSMNYWREIKIHDVVLNDLKNEVIYKLPDQDFLNKIFSKEYSVLNHFFNFHIVNTLIEIKKVGEILRLDNSFKINMKKNIVCLHFLKIPLPKPWEFGYKTEFNQTTLTNNFNWYIKEYLKIITTVSIDAISKKIFKKYNININEKVKNFLSMQPITIEEIYENIENINKVFNTVLKRNVDNEAIVSYFYTNEKELFNILKNSDEYRKK